MLADLDVLGFSQVKLVMDRGFYSKDNINALFKEHLKFLISTKMNLTFIRQELDPIYDEFRTFDHYSEKYELYHRTVQTKWDYSQYRPYKGNTLSEKRRIYIHYYYNIDRAAEEEKVFDRKLIKLCQELETGQRILEPESTTKNTSRRKLHLNVVLW